MRLRRGTKRQGICIEVFSSLGWCAFMTCLLMLETSVVCCVVIVGLLYFYAVTLFYFYSVYAGFFSVGIVHFCTCVRTRAEMFTHLLYNWVLYLPGKYADDIVQNNWDRGRNTACIWRNHTLCHKKPSLFLYKTCANIIVINIIMKRPIFMTWTCHVSITSTHFCGLYGQTRCIQPRWRPLDLARESPLSK